MSVIANHIDHVNSKNKKALSIFLTAGYPNVESFVELALGILDAGADMLEIGLPFGDSLADGPVIQSSYTKALSNNVNNDVTLELISEIRNKTEKPLILMSSANPVVNIKPNNKYFTKENIDGLIIPDVPLEEHNTFFDKDHYNQFDKILLTTPTSSDRRITEIDNTSTGFVYCVSVVGITGARKEFDDYVTQNLKRTYNLVTKNKMLIGFGISTDHNIKNFSPHCDGFIVGSAVVKKLANSNGNYSELYEYIKYLSNACYF